MDGLTVGIEKIARPTPEYSEIRSNDAVRSRASDRAICRAVAIAGAPRVESRPATSENWPERAVA